MSARRPRVTIAVFVGAALVVALALAFFASPFASSDPDGLEKVAADHGFAEQESSHALEDSPTAGYAVRGVDDEGTSTALAGVFGVTITFLVATGVTVALRRTRGHRVSRATSSAS